MKQKIHDGKIFTLKVINIFENPQNLPKDLNQIKTNVLVLDQIFLCLIQKSLVNKFEKIFWSHQKMKKSQIQ